MTCKHGHIDAGRYGNGRCRECARQYQREHERNKRRELYGYGCASPTAEQLERREELIDERRERKRLMHPTPEQLATWERVLG